MIPDLYPWRRLTHVSIVESQMGHQKKSKIKTDIYISEPPDIRSRTVAWERGGIFSEQY